MNLLSIDGLQVTLGGRPVLAGISCRVAPGEFVGLIGPNGAGKSTLLRATLGLIPSVGSIIIAGRDAHGISARERARQVAYVPQERDIAWPIAVAALVGLGREPHRRPFAPPGKADKEAVEHAMRRMDVAAFRNRPATELSGGEKARVLIARALAQDAPLLLADEPTSGLDPSHQIALMRVFAGLAFEGRGVVASMHDLGLAARWCSRVILLDRGAIVADGSPDKVLTSERLHAVYGVTAYIGEVAGGMIVHPLDTSDDR